MKKIAENKVYIIAGIIILVALIAFGSEKSGKVDVKGMFQKEKILTQEEIKTKALDYVNKNLVQPGTEVKIDSIVEEAIATGGKLYKIDFDVAGQKIPTYMTMDGKKFFPNAMDLAEAEKQAAEKTASAEKSLQDMPKNDKPVVELFVMSYCPYGTQIEKGILPVVDTLGSKIDFQLKFVDYAMHEKKEMDENLREYCIDKNQPEKLSAYLKCFLKKGEGTENACMLEAGVSASQVSSCMSAADSQFRITQNYKDKTTWKGQFPPFNVHKADNEKYQVQGSPTLVINGTVAEASKRDSASLMKTICAGFSQAPKECEASLSTDAPAPGFGEGTGASSDASCAN